jgi:DNA invertase Pin-like site-specific DNA recombinase
MMRQIAGSFAQYEKNRLVRKLREARERSGKLGGRKSLAEARPETVALARELHARGLSYRRIASELAVRGHVTSSGKPYMASAIQKMQSPLASLCPDGNVRATSLEPYVNPPLRFNNR